MIWHGMAWDIPGMCMYCRYEEFVQKIIARRNDLRSNKLLEELDLLKPLPERKYYAPEILELKVTTSSTIRVDQITYSVPSRLIGYSLRAYVYQGEIKLYYGNQFICSIAKIDSSKTRSWRVRFN